MRLSNRIAAARGDMPADLLLKNARAVLLGTGEIEETDVAVAGSWIVGPFLTLGVLGLEVIPSLKITDRGLVEVDRSALVPLFPEEAPR